MIHRDATNIKENEVHSFEHYTLNTGDRYRSPKTNFSAALKPLFSPLIKQGIHRLPAPFNDYWVRSTAHPDPKKGGLLASVYRDPEIPLVVMAVAKNRGQADVMWHVICDCYASVNISPVARPHEHPWCCVVCYPTIVLDVASLDWLGDFERCLAWTWISTK